MVQSRFSGAMAGPGSDSFSGYWGNTGSGKVRPLGGGTRTGPGAEFISKLWMSTSMRNFGTVAILSLLELPSDFDCAKQKPLVSRRLHSVATAPTPRRPQARLRRRVSLLVTPPRVPPIGPQSRLQLSACG